MGLITTWLKNNFNFDFDKTLKLCQKTSEYWKKITGVYIYPNGLLGGLPVYITDFKFSKSSSVTSNILFYGDEIVDNLEKKSYEITLNVICFGKNYLDRLNELKQLATTPIGEENIISLFYQKDKIYYYPLVITNIDYSDNSDTTRLQSFSIKLKQIDVALITELNDSNYSTFTSVLIKDNSYISSITEEFQMPQNLYEELKENIPQFKEVINVFKNFI